MSRTAVAAIGRTAIARQARAGARLAAAWLWQLSGSGLRRLAARTVILTYHRVLPASALAREVVQAGMYVRDDTFDMQMRFLREHFEVVSIARLLRLWDRGRYDESRRYAVVTFDDGWLDNYRYAYPVLKHHGIPATIFLATGLVGTAGWFWPEKLAYVLAAEEAARPAAPGRQVGSLADRLDAEVEALKAFPEAQVEALIEERRGRVGAVLPATRLLLDWAEVEEMSRHGISFGSHSCSHRLLSRLAPEERRREVTESLAALRRQGVSAVPVFAYPNGDYTAEVVEDVCAAGYRAAVGSRPGWEGAAPSARFALRRIGVHQDVTATPALYEARLSGLDGALAGLGWARRAGGRSS